MKLLIVFALVAIAAAAPTEKEVKVLEEYKDSEPNGSYKNGFKLDNGVQQQEEGTLTDVIDDDKVTHSVIFSRGLYLLPKEDGSFGLVEWSADQNGFHPKSELLPVPPQPLVA